MDINTQGQDFWDLDLRVEPARQWPGKIGLTMTTETTFTVTKILSRLPTGCANSNNCAQPRVDAYGAQR